MHKPDKIPICQRIKSDGLRNRTIDKQQAHLMLYAMNLATQNLPNCQKGDQA